MAILQKNKETYELQEDGSYVLKSTETIEVEVKTEEEMIAEKEAELLAMYKELETLKAANTAE